MGVCTTNNTKGATTTIPTQRVDGGNGVEKEHGKFWGIMEVRVGEMGLAWHKYHKCGADPELSKIEGATRSVVAADDELRGGSGSGGSGRRHMGG